MNDLDGLVLAAFLGLAVGMIFFGLLYVTVMRLRSARRPVLLAFASLAGRMLVTVAVLYLLVRGGYWQRAPAFLVGFLVARTLLVKRYKPEAGGPADAAGLGNSGGDR